MDELQHPVAEECTEARGCLSHTFLKCHALREEDCLLKAPELLQSLGCGGGRLPTVGTVNGGIPDL